MTKLSFQTFPNTVIGGPHSCEDTEVVHKRTQLLSVRILFICCFLHSREFQTHMQWSMITCMPLPPLLSPNVSQTMTLSSFHAHPHWDNLLSPVHSSLMYMDVGTSAGVWETLPVATHPKYNKYSYPNNCQLPVASQVGMGLQEVLLHLSRLIPTRQHFKACLFVLRFLHSSHPHFHYAPWALVVPVVCTWAHARCYEKDTMLFCSQLLTASSPPRQPHHQWITNSPPPTRCFLPDPKLQEPLLGNPKVIPESKVGTKSKL